MEEQEFQLFKKGYHSELVAVIRLVGEYVKSSAVIDGDLLSIEFFDDFGGRYNLTIDTLADKSFDRYKRYQITMSFDGDFRYQSTFSNISFVRQTVRMLLDWYAE